MIEMYELRDAAPTLLSLAIIEVLLSMDRLLEVSESAEHLPAEQRRTAVRFGGMLADVARFGGLVGAGLLFSFIWTKILGAAYLLYLMSSHFAPKKNEGAAPVTTHWSMGTSILQVALLDLSLSMGNIVAALTLTREVWIVGSSVIFWMLFTRVFGSPLLKLVKRFPVLTNNVPILVGGIGSLLLVEIVSKYRGMEGASPEQKLAGLVVLVLVCALYDLVTPLQKALAPILSAVGMPIIRVLNAVLSVVFWPLRAIQGDLVSK